MALTVYTYANCSICRDAVKWLRAHRVDFTEKPIYTEPPTVAELIEKWNGVPGGKDLGDINDLGLDCAWNGGAGKVKLLAPVDLQCVKAAGVTFAIGQFAVSNFVGPELTDTLAALLSLASVAVLLKFWQPNDAYVAEYRGMVETTRDPSSRVWRAYGTYGILVLVVLIGQSGNFAGMSQVKPPANVTALLRCGQAGFKLCPDPWVGPNAADAPQAQLLRAQEIVGGEVVGAG